MSGINKVIIVGRLGQDPEVKSVSSGQQVARLNIATSETWVDKSNQKQERTEWHRVVLWGKQAELAGRYLTKGRQVYIEGKLQTRSWEDATSGQKKYSTEIVAQTIQFLGGASGETRTNATEGADNSYNDFGPEPTFAASDDIPF